MQVVRPVDTPERVVWDHSRRFEAELCHPGDRVVREQIALLGVCSDGLSGTWEGYLVDEVVGLGGVGGQGEGSVLKGCL